MVGAVHAALAGLRAQLEHFEATAERLARAAPGGDLAGDLVALKLSRDGLAANVRTVRTADEMLGTLLDLVL